MAIPGVPAQSLMDWLDASSDPLFLQKRGTKEEREQREKMGRRAQRPAGGNRLPRKTSSGGRSLAAGQGAQARVDKSTRAWPAGMVCDREEAGRFTTLQSFAGEGDVGDEGRKEKE